MARCRALYGTRLVGISKSTCWHKFNSMASIAPYFSVPRNRHVRRRGYVASVRMWFKTKGFASWENSSVMWCIAQVFHAKHRHFRAQSWNTRRAYRTRSFSIRVWTEQIVDVARRATSSGNPAMKMNHLRERIWIRGQTLKSLHYS